jgi:hypothetical protein
LLFLQEKNSKRRHDPLLRAGFAAAKGTFCSKRTANNRPLSLRPVAPIIDTPAMWRILRRLLGAVVLS